MTLSLISALRAATCYPHAVRRIEVLETHISWVILTGQYAYKIKKPVNMGFLDFSTIESRRRCCEDELRLNRRLAPTLYEAVATINGSGDTPRIDGNGPVLEYAVKMLEFPQDALASNLLQAGLLTGAHIDALAARIAAFHADAGVAAHGSTFGSTESVIASARENFTQLARLLPEAADEAGIAQLRAWTEHEYNTRLDVFSARQAGGFVRECHGDLHLSNIVMLDGMLTPFDCIEFNPALRWIDVMSEVAFLVMDLMDRGHAMFAFRFLNAYLECCGDYDGLEVLRFYLLYRALVRAKVHALRATQDGITPVECSRLLDAARGYVTLAQRCAATRNPAIILMHGVSASGKSVIARALAAETGAIHLRSDVERKRLRGMTALQRSGSTLTSGIYTADNTLATYKRLLELTRMAATAKYDTVVDATFLKRWQRDLFRHQAAAHGIPLIIVHVTAPDATLRARIRARLAASTDASEADQTVLDHQLHDYEGLGCDEAAAAIRIDTTLAGEQASAREAREAVRAWLNAQDARPAPRGQHS